MKGRANYLCRHKLVALRDQPILSGLEEIDQYRQIAEWEQTTETGDRAELSGLPESSALWHKLDARTEACLGSTCPDYRRCFITEMRRKALESDIIIVNHHLFFADLSVKQEAAGAPDAGILPEAAAVIFDEAHELEEVASSYFGLSVSNIRFEELARDTDACCAARRAPTKSPRVTQQLRERARMFFAGAAHGRRRPPALHRPRRVPRNLRRPLHGVRATLKRLEAEMERLKGVDEAPGLRKRVAACAPSSNSCSNRTPATWSIGWSAALGGGTMQSRAVRSARAQLPRRNRGHFLQATPIDVSELLHELVFDQIPTVVLTSATLTVQGGFEHMRKRLGLSEARELVVPSHFRYGEQALLYLPPTCPTRASPISRGRRQLHPARARITRGRAFCLFTSYSQMRDLYERLLPVLDFPILLHGTAPRKALLESSATRPTPSSSAHRASGRAWTCRASAELRHHRPPALRRAQRSGRRRRA
jgi:ATP-dependent DNA helicase DinG